jgi:adenosylmethionine-8-amino-7-oxononanoate aminotransferase
MWWGVEFELDAAAQAKLGKGNQFGLVVQEICFRKGLIIMGFSGTVDGVKGDHVMLSPALNVTKKEVEEIADVFIASVEDAVKLLA